MSAPRACGTLQQRGCRCFSITSSVWSGHNRWSKIKHDKAKVDASVSKQRSALAVELTRVSKKYGRDPQTNPRLADAITAAKRLSFPKDSIERAIAKGQGISPSGVALENLTVEAMVPPSVAVIIECQTDSKLRTLADLRLAVKDAGGSVTPTNHLFERKGKIIFEKTAHVGHVEAIDQAIEAGAIDVEVIKEDDEEEVVVFTEPSQTVAVADAFAQSSGLKLKSSDIIWDPKEDMMVKINSSETLESFLARVHNEPSVQEVYTNIN